jgi:hypothetical protein
MIDILNGGSYDGGGGGGGYVCPPTCPTATEVCVTISWVCRMLLPVELYLPSHYKPATPTTHINIILDHTNRTEFTTYSNQRSSRSPAGKWESLGSPAPWSPLAVWRRPGQAEVPSACRFLAVLSRAGPYRKCHPRPSRGGPSWHRRIWTFCIFRCGTSLCSSAPPAEGSTSSLQIHSKMSLENCCVTDAIVKALHDHLFRKNADGFNALHVVEYL